MLRTMQNSPRLYIREWRKAAGLTQDQLAFAIGRDKSVVSKLERGKSGLTEVVINAIADTLRVPPQALYMPPGDEPNNLRLAGPEDPLPARASWPRDVPVHGTAAGAVTGAMQIEADSTVDYVLRPPGIAGARDVYGLYVVGDSMEPRYFEGDLVYVHPGRPVRVGDFVVVQTQAHDHDPPQSYIKRLTRRTAENVILEQFNPAETFITIPARFVIKMHRVLTTNDLMGV